MGREVRRVPALWEHPKDSSGHFVPLMGDSYSERLSRWYLDLDRFARGMWAPGDDGKEEPHGKKLPENATPSQIVIAFQQWDGERPDERDYMPDWPEAERTHFQMYENTTEGTPISPVMDSPESLARWLADNGASAFGGMTADYEAWLRVCRGGYAPSAVIERGVMKSGVEALGEES